MENIDFVLFDSESMMEELEEKFTEESGEPLYEGDERETVLRCMLYLGECLANKVNAQANNSLVMFCDEAHLLYYGAERDTYRLEAENARCTVRFRASSLSPSSVEVPEGTRVTADGKAFFAASEGFSVEPGGYADIECVATEAGSSGNGYQAGQVNTLANTIPYIESVSNLGATGGGSDEEDLEDFRTDVLYAPLKFNTTGSVGGYRFKAKGVSSSIADVEVTANGANISVYLLCEDGELPTESLIGEVQEYLTQPLVKPATDNVTVLSAVRAPYSVSMSYKVSKRDYATSSAICEAVEDAVAAYIKDAGSRMGTAINPEMLKKAAYQAGAASVSVEAPAEYREIESYEAPYCESCAISYDGLLGD